MPTQNLAENIILYQSQIAVNKRFASYDFCYNYFQQNKGQLSTPQNIEHSCYVLFSYLASWGMLRGSSQLLQCSPAALIKLIRHFDSIKDSPIWDWDVPDYADSNNIQKIIDEYKQIENILASIFSTEESTSYNYEDEAEDKNEKKSNAAASTSNTTNSVPTDTLITKIMLGVFGVIPAFDTYFKKTMRNIYKEGTKVSSPFSKCSKDALKCILDFYLSNKVVFDAIKIIVHNFSGLATGRYYKIAKLIDMFGFITEFIVDQGKKSSNTTSNS